MKTTTILLFGCPVLFTMIIMMTVYIQSGIKLVFDIKETQVYNLHIDQDIYNGYVKDFIVQDDTDYNLLVIYLQGKAELQATETVSFIARLNVTSSDNEMTDAVNQFQVIDGKIDTSLSLLFGGSPSS